MATSTNKINLTIPFSTIRTAQIAYEVLRVDTEPERSKVTKVLSVEENNLKAEFTAPSVKQIRVAVNAFFDNIILIGNTIDCMGPPVSDTYSHY